MIQQLFTLIDKDIRLEWRRKYIFNGLILYAVACVFVVYSAFFNVKPTSWLVLLWIVLLFASANAVAGSFLNESSNRQAYYQILCAPNLILLSKLIYNTLLLTVLAFLEWFFFILLLGNPVEHNLLLAASLLLGAFSFSSAFTLVAAIAARAGGSGTLMPILSFPIIIPIIKLLIDVSLACLQIDVADSTYRSMGILVVINIVLISLSLLLFPYLWRD